MFLEIEETVCFITSFLYGKIPKSRTDLFADTLANGLVDRIYTGSRPLKSYCLIVDVVEKLIDEAASCAFISNSELGELLPANLLIEIYDGSVHAVNTDTGHVKCVYPERCCFTDLLQVHMERFYSSSWFDVGTLAAKIFKPNLDSHLFNRNRPIRVVQRCEKIYPAHNFAATRFGSTKFKSYKPIEGVYDGNRCHPFTTPSTIAYLRLFEFLDTIALAATMIEKNDEDTSTQKAIEGFLKGEKGRLMVYAEEESTSNEIADDHDNTHSDREMRRCMGKSSEMFLHSKIVGVETVKMNV
ncbi:unnamed protein product [Angiostrongylus costaricensis]|uniref:Phosphorylase b kinase regulatory subunit n=1 Tax=Angiostrongylus costaricensis TaxID=334426 RepID=A0A158PGQ8_ANGCS|nr:unnamed protein product [Angiostrongylus costaricensis]